MGSSRRALNRGAQKKQTLSNPNFARKPKPKKFTNEKKDGGKTKEQIKEPSLPELKLV
jgi:hypothetical protein